MRPNKRRGARSGLRRKMFVAKWAAICAVFCTVLIVEQEPTMAQEVEVEDESDVRRTGIGAQLGLPSGITLRFHRSDRLSYEFLGAFNLNNFFFLNASGLFSFGLNDRDWGYFIGPGAFVGFYDDEGTESVTLGVSIRTGVSYYYGIFEFFGQVTPRFDLLTESDAAFGAGVGARIYF